MTLPDWNFDYLEELIESRGDNVVLETSVSCTCRREDVVTSLSTKEYQPTTARKLNCQICQGNGYMYRNARCVRGLLTSVQSGPNKKLIEAGYAVPGDCVFSPSLHVGYIGDFDKITFTTPDFVGEGQIIYRGGAKHNEINGIRVGVEDNEDKLWYQAACAVWCEDENGVIYSQGSDFKLIDTVIQWVGNAPNVGTFYTLKYTAYIEWIAYNVPMLRIDNARSLAQKVLLRKKHVAFHTGSTADTAAKRKVEQDTLTTRTKI